MEIKLDNYNVVDGQVLIIRVPVGGLPQDKAQEYLQHVGRAFKDEIERADFKRVGLFIFPENPNDEKVTIETLTPKDGEKYIINVPVDGLPAKERIMYLKMLKTHFDEEWVYPDCGFVIAPFGTNMVVQ